MNRVINDPDQVVEDMLRGILVAHPELRQYETNPRVLVKAKPSGPGRVGVSPGAGRAMNRPFSAMSARDWWMRWPSARSSPRPLPRVFSTRFAQPTMAQVWLAFTVTTLATT